MYYRFDHHLVVAKEKLAEKEAEENSEGLHRPRLTRGDVDGDDMYSRVHPYDYNPIYDRWRLSITIVSTAARK